MPMKSKMFNFIVQEYIMDIWMSVDAYLTGETQNVSKVVDVVADFREFQIDLCVFFFIWRKRAWDFMRLVCVLHRVQGDECDN